MDAHAVQRVSSKHRILKTKHIIISGERGKDDAKLNLLRNAKNVSKYHKNNLLDTTQDSDNHQVSHIHCQSSSSSSSVAAESGFRRADSAWNMMPDTCICIMEHTHTRTHENAQADTHVYMYNTILYMYVLYMYIHTQLNFLLLTLCHVIHGGGINTHTMTCTLHAYA